MPHPEAGSAATSSRRTTSTCRCGWPGSPPTGATSARSRSPATAPSSLTLPVGSYRLQFTDKRPSYDVTKFAPTDATVTVRSGSTAVRNVRMHRGAAITGTVRTAAGSGSHATVTAANKAEQSFSTIANDKGQFAIGGLPAGSYSVFTYDHKKTYVAKSTYVKKLAAGHPQNIDIKLNKRAGNLLVDLYAGDQPINGTLMVTAISKKTGQFWTMKARNGTADLRGVYPGRYTLIVPGYRDFFGKTGTVSRGKVSRRSHRLRQLPADRARRRLHRPPRLAGRRAEGHRQRHGPSLRRRPARWSPRRRPRPTAASASAATSATSPRSRWSPSTPRRRTTT